MPMKDGNKAKVIYFTPEEWKCVVTRSELARLKTGTFIKRISTLGEINVYDTKDILSFAYSINAYGLSLNQIAKVANSTNSIYKADINKIQEDFKVLQNIIFSRLEEIIVPKKEK